ncbi:ankyrin repeat domain-containing protein [Bacteroidota bacterium]
MKSLVKLDYVDEHRTGTINENEPSKESIKEYIATLFGGSEIETSWAIALDDENNVYVGGYTYSSDFPSTTGTYNSTHKGKADVFVLKFDKDLTTILASVIIGGSEDEVAYSILYDSNGFIYVAGYTCSSDFPVTSSAYSKTYSGGDGDAFILKMDKNLRSLVASTFIGGSGNEDDWFSAEIVQDNYGNIYIAGNTSSTDFPTTPQAYCSNYNGGEKDVFIAKFDSDLKYLLASTLFGGTAGDMMSRSLKIDKQKDRICIAGTTSSKDFPTTKNAYSNHITGGEPDGFISKFTTDLSVLTSSTILEKGWIYCLFIHENGDIYVGGHGSKKLPTTPNAYYTTFDKHFCQGFISRFSNDLSKIKSSTLLPGTGRPFSGGECTPGNIAQDSDGNIISSGQITSLPKDFPATPNAFDETHNGVVDIYIMKMNKELSELNSLSFIGGSNKEWWDRLVVDNDDNCYVTSYTISKDFPTTTGSAFESINGDNIDGLVYRLNEDFKSVAFDEFHDAAKRDNLKRVISLLSKNGELLEKTDKYKRTPLHSAARFGALSVCKYLIDRGADLNAKDESGNTALHLAVIHCHENVAEVIVQANADLNRINFDGESALFLANVFGTVKTMRLLLSKNGDSNLRDKEGNTLLHYSALSGNIEKVEEIFKHNLDIEARNNTGDTPLLSAVKRTGNQSVIGALIENGANIAAVDKAGKGVLHLAQTSNIEFLLEKEAEINLQDKDGNTPLHKECFDIVTYKTLYPFTKSHIIIYIKAGADRNIKNKLGKSPFDIVMESGVKEAIELFTNL